MAKRPAKRRTSAKKAAKKKISKKSTAKRAKAKEKTEQNPLVALRREMDALFDRFAGFLPFETLSKNLFDIEPFRGWSESWPLSPSIDLTETKTGYVVEAELPGMNEDNIEVSLSDGFLTISGEKKEEKKDKRAHVSERRYGSFQRAFRVSDSIDEVKANAEFNNGVLRITLPKRKKAQKEPQKIEVQTV